MSNIKDAQEESYKLYEAIINCEDGYISHKIEKAMQILSDALRLYGPDQLFSSFNGGKDAVVIMHLMRAVLAKYNHNRDIDLGFARPKFIYFAIDDEFSEVLEHIEETKVSYALDLITYNNGIVQGLTEHVTNMNEQGLRNPAFVLGTRQGDPNSHDQQPFCPSSNWISVSFMRINPILDWDYGHVWHFLRTFNLPYCILYDQGFTSLGKKSETRPNYMLKRKNSDNNDADSFDKNKIDTTQSQSILHYWPAYMLSDWTKERAGRGAETYTQHEKDTDIEEYNKGVGILIIGDEILSGFTQESNLIVASNALSSVGIPLRRVVLTNDTCEDIEEEVLRMSQKYKYVITSGGVGPTHDDVTLKAIAKALKQDIVENKEMLAHLERVLSTSVEAMDVATKRLANLPEDSKLLLPPEDSEEMMNSIKNDHPIWPTLLVENVFALPGIPKIFAEKIELLVKYFIEKGEKKLVKKLILNLDESSIVLILDSFVNEWNDRVKIGCYPYHEHLDYKTILTVEGKGEGEDAAIVDSAVTDLLLLLPSESILRVE